MLGSERFPLARNTVLIVSLRLYLMTFATSLEGQTSVNIAPIVTSSFGAHSLISTVYVVQAVVNGRSP